MKKEMKIVLPFYKIAYAVSFVVIFKSVIRAVVFTYEIGLSIEPPFCDIDCCFLCRYLCAGNYKQPFRSSETVSDKKENLFYYTETDDTGYFFAAARCSWIWIVFLRFRNQLHIQ